MVGSETDPGVESGIKIIWMVEEVYRWVEGQFAELFSLSIYLSKTGWGRSSVGSACGAYKYLWLNASVTKTPHHSARVNPTLRFGG